MVQIYFLLVLFNIIMGFILIKDFLNSKLDNFSNIHHILSVEIFQVTVGCIGTIVGLLALFLRFTGNMIIIGDLVPSIIAMICGFTLFIEYIANEEENDSAAIKFFKTTFLQNRVLLGFISLTSGILHFIAPSLELL